MFKISYCIAFIIFSSVCVTTLINKIKKLSPNYLTVVGKCGGGGAEIYKEPLKELSLSEKFPNK